MERPQKEEPQELSVILSRLENRLFRKKTFKGMRLLVCENLSCGTSSPNKVTSCLEKKAQVKQIPYYVDRLFVEVTRMEQFPLKRRELA